MCSNEPRTQLGSVSEGGEHEPGTIAQFPAVDGAGVTVPTEPRPPGGADTPVSRTGKRRSAGRTGHNLVVRGIRRDPPDLHKLAQVIASLAAAMVEDETDEQPGLANPEASDTAIA